MNEFQITSKGIFGNFKLDLKYQKKQAHVKLFVICHAVMFI